MQITAQVSRGVHRGEMLYPHRYSNGGYVVSSSKFSRDYHFVYTLSDVRDAVHRGLSVRMSGDKVCKSPRLISPISITISR